MPPVVSGQSRARLRLTKAGIPALIAALALVVGALLALVWLPPSETDLSSYRLTPFATEAGEESAPAWSPDGRTLAYEFVVDGIRQIYTRSLDAPSGTRITSSAADCQRPFWSPNGRGILLLSLTTEALVRQSGGWHSAHSCTENATTAAISPDGKTLVLTRELDRRCGAFHRFTPWGPNRNLTARLHFPASSPRFPFPSLARRFQVRGVHFTPCGHFRSRILDCPVPLGHAETIAASSPRKSDPPAISELDAGQPASGFRRCRSSCIAPDTRSGLRQITSSTVAETQPAVSPDGHRIAFTSGTSDFNIVQIALDGSSSKPLLATSPQRDGAGVVSGECAIRLCHDRKRRSGDLAARRERRLGETAGAAGERLQLVRDSRRFSPDGGRRFDFDEYGERGDGDAAEPSPKGTP